MKTLQLFSDRAIYGVGNELLRVTQHNDKFLPVLYFQVMYYLFYTYFV